MPIYARRLYDSLRSSFIVTEHGASVMNNFSFAPRFARCCRFLVAALTAELESALEEGGLMSALKAREVSEAALRLAHAAAAEERRQEEESLAKVKAEEEVRAKVTADTAHDCFATLLTPPPLVAAHRLLDRSAEEGGAGGPGEGGAEAEGGGGEEAEGGEGGGESKDTCLSANPTLPPY